MNCDVVVIGAGVGGLTVAALLAARGVDVCLFERQSRTGGCIANFEHLGYTFEPTAGLYSGWEPGGIYERIFSKLQTKLPEVQKLSPSYLVRLPDQTEVALIEDIEKFETELRHAFPECADAAIKFYRDLAEGMSALPDDLAGAHLSDCSPRFRSFIDIQLQALTQCPSDVCSYVRAADALRAPLRGMWTIRGGAQALADALAESLKQSGGRLRLDSPVLRLAYGSDGMPIGIDLLSGERVTATRAIISNLTIWDTYGKLIGPGRTPPAVSAQIKRLHASGTYLLFGGIDEDAAAGLRAHTTLIGADWPKGKEESEQAQLTFAVAPEWDSRAPGGKRAVTVSTYVNAEDWFAFHSDETSHEQQDQAALESLWSRLHQAMPELGDSIEVIETSTPRTVYETTRRKFGLAGKLCPQPAHLFPDPRFGTTIFPNVFMIGDTVCSGSGLEGICDSAIVLADALTSD